MPRDSRSLPRAGLALRAGRFVALMAVVFASSCWDEAASTEDQPTDDASPTEFHDSAGVTIAIARLSDGIPHWWIDPEPDLRVGHADGDLPYLFQRPEFAARLSDGRVVVADFGSGELRWFDGGGRFLQSVGRKGEGPWEFREFNRVVRLPGDTLVVYDLLNQRLTRVGPDGELLSGRSLRDLLAARSVARWRPYLRPEFPTIVSGGTARRVRWRNLVLAGPVGGGAHAMAFASAADPPPPRQVDTMRARTALAHLGDEGERGVFTDLPGPLQIPAWIDERPDLGLIAVPSPVPFATAPLMAARGGPLVASETGRYEIAVYDPVDGLVRIIRRGDVAPHRVTRDLLERFVEWTVDGPSTMREQAARDWASTSFELAGDAYHLPTHAELYLDVAGRIWVEDWRFPWDDGDPRTFTVFEPGGRIVALATVPPELWITDIGLDYLTGVVWDELGVEYVHVHSIHR